MADAGSGREGRGAETVNTVPWYHTAVPQYDQGYYNKGTVLSYNKGTVQLYGRMMCVIVPQ